MMLKKIVMASLITAMAATVVTPVFAGQALNAAVRQIDTPTAALFGATPGAPGTVGCRYYSKGTLGPPVANTDPGINNSTAACTNVRCLRNYATAAALGGGFVCNGEDTSGYNGDADNQEYYVLVDGEMNAGTGTHIGYYAISGQIGGSTTPTNPGFHVASGCTGTTFQNCFTAMEVANARALPLLNTWASFSGPNQIGSAGGLSPNPTVRVALPGPGCAAGEARLTWDNPEAYTATMKNGLGSPTLGVRLWKNTNSCTSAPDGNVTNWTSIGTFGMGAGSTGTCHAITGSSWFSTTVRFKGPTGAATEIESGVQGGAGFVGANSQCVAPVGTVTRIVRISARYAGRGTVNVNWTTGVESGVQGYYVQRADSPAGPYTRVSEMITPRGESSDYSFGDRVRAGLGRPLYYTIQIVNADGTTETSGSVAVNLPASKRKITPGNQ